MATYSTGISATWDGTPFVEVYELGLPLYGSVRKDRSSSGTSTGWSDEVGDVSVSAYGTTESRGTRSRRNYWTGDTHDFDQRTDYRGR
jgi:hypothetical protein